MPWRIFDSLIHSLFCTIGDEFLHKEILKQTLLRDFYLLCGTQQNTADNLILIDASPANRNE